MSSGLSVSVCASGWDSLHESESCGSVGLNGVIVTVDCLAASKSPWVTGDSLISLGVVFVLSADRPMFCV